MAYLKIGIMASWHHDIMASWHHGIMASSISAEIHSEKIFLGPLLRSDLISLLQAVTKAAADADAESDLYGYQPPVCRRLRNLFVYRSL